jgi:methionine-rich copper-binding protein CopC
MRTTLLSIALIATVLLSGCATSQPAPNQPSVDVQPTPAPIVETPEPVRAEPTYTFANPVKSAHYVSNVPTHGTIVGELPTEIGINFNFDLAAPSEIRVTVDGVDVTTGTTRIESSLLTLTQAIDPSAPDGLYKVSYTACWPDTTCHEGSFEFAVYRP